MTEPRPSIRPLITQEDAAERMGLSVDALRRMRDAGTGPVFLRIGNRIRYFAEDVSAFIGAQLPLPLPAEAPSFHPVRVYERTEPPKAIAALPGLFQLPFETDKTPGVYFLCAGDEVVYCGQSLDVVGRIRTHALWEKRGRFDSAFGVPVPSGRLLQVEAYMIRALRPPLNKTAGISGVFDSLGASLVSFVNGAGA